MGDAEWALIEPHLPRPKADGSHRLLRGKDMAWPMRRVVDGVFYILWNGVPWRVLPADFPPWETVYYWFRRFAREALFERLNAALVILDRERAGREASPSAAVIDSQTVKATEAPALLAFDGGKKIVGIKRHAMVDVDGRMRLVGFSKADLHDSRGDAALLATSRRHWPFVELVRADSAYRGRRVEAAAAPAKVGIVSGLVGQKGFVVQKRRWVVERSFAWFNRSRWLWRVCEVALETISAMTYAASVFTLMRRIGRRANG